VDHPYLVKHSTTAENGGVATGSEAGAARAQGAGGGSRGVCAICHDPSEVRPRALLRSAAWVAQSVCLGRAACQARPLVSWYRLAGMSEPAVLSWSRAEAWPRQQQARCHMTQAGEGAGGAARCLEGVARGAGPERPVHRLGLGLTHGGAARTRWARTAGTCSAARA